MIAKREVWNYAPSVKVWVGKYKNSQNLLHWHYDCELLYVEKGEIDVFCERKMHTLVTGEMLYVDSGQVHYMHAKDPSTTLIVIVFDYETLRVHLGDVRLASPKLAHSYPVPEIYRELRDILLRKQPFYGLEAACKVMQLMLAVFRSEEVVPRGTTSQTSRRFMSLLEELSEKYAYYTFSDAASFMGMSESYFSRYFRTTTGTTFSQYLNYVRTNRAIELIHGGEDLSMTEISLRCGFGTIRNFNRIFRELTGYSPKNIPPDYLISDSFVYPSTAPFNPTLYDCELIEANAPRE